MKDKLNKKKTPVIDFELHLKSGKITTIYCMDYFFINNLNEYVFKSWGLESTIKIEKVDYIKQKIRYID